MTVTLHFEWFTNEGEHMTTVKTGVNPGNIATLYRDLSDAIGLIGGSVNQMIVIPNTQGVASFCSGRVKE